MCCIENINRRVIFSQKSSIASVALSTEMKICDIERSSGIVDVPHLRGAVHAETTSWQSCASL